MKKFLFTLALLISLTAWATKWNVGPSRTYTLPSQVKNLVNDGDTIYLDGAVYANDAVKWTKKKLVFIGLGLGANRATLQYTGDIPNGKGIWVFETAGTCDDTYIENIVFDGAQISDLDGANGAGIRYQANNLRVNLCKFMNCQNGILEGNGAVTTSNVIIENSEFLNNGYQLPNDPTYSGYEHNIYISASADTLWVENCYFHDPRGQANSLKTRAQRSFILYNFIDERVGYGSWELNIAQGGLNIIMGNVIIQGTGGANHGIISYDAATNALEDFYFVNNTVINEYSGNNKYFSIVPSSGINTFKIYNNIFASVPSASNTIYGGNVPSVLDSSNNIYANDYLTLGFANTGNDDYSLTALSTYIIDKGISAGTANSGFSLNPSWEYRHCLNPQGPRFLNGSAIDFGAYEYNPGIGITENTSPEIRVFPNPSNGTFNIKAAGSIQAKIVDLNGRELYLKSGAGLINVECNLPAGVYILKIAAEKGITIKRLVINN